MKEFVSIRPGPSATGEIGRLNKGERAPLLESVPHWYKIQQPNGQPGFVPKAWTEIATEDPNVSPPTATSASFKIHFLDVGTGDSAIIDMGEQEILIDGGNYANDLHDYIKQEDIVQGTIELVIVTHGDQDHWKGMVRLFNFDGQGTTPRTLREFWDPGYNRDCNLTAAGRKNYLDFISKVKNMSGIIFKRPLETFHAPSTKSNQLAPFSLPGISNVKFTVLHSAQTPPDQGDCAYKINNASIVVMIEINGVRILFTGDANGKERNEPSPGTPGHIEKLLLDLEAQNPGMLKADILKVPHHGSETASTQAFIDKVNPKFVIISASTTHHLPKQTTLDRYINGQRVILKTDVNVEKGKDHVICASVVVGEVDCNYKTVWEEH